MEYKKVIIYRDENGDFTKAVVETNFGVLEILDKDKVKVLLQEFAHQKGLDLDVLLTNEELVNEVVVRIHEEPKDDKEHFEEDRPRARYASEEEADEVVFDVDHKKKKKKKGNSGFIKKLVTYASVIAVLATGSVVLVRSKVGGKVVKFFQNIGTNIEDTFNGNKNDNNIQNITVVNPGDTSESEYDKVMQGVIKRQDETNEVTSQLTNNKVVELTHEQILSALNDNTRIANSSIFEVSQYINGHELTGNAYYNNFESIFGNNNMDYYAVKKFSDMRNEVLRLVYEAKDVERAKAAIRDFYSLYTEFVTLEKKCIVKVDGKDVTVNFSELSDMAQATVLDLGIAMFTINLDYNYYYDNRVCTKIDILDDSINMLEGQLVPRLINKGYSK